MNESEKKGLASLVKRTLRIHRMDEEECTGEDCEICRIIEEKIDEIENR